MIGMDIASSIDQAYNDSRAEPCVDFVQADIMTPPFVNGSFDFVSCKLALCYLSDPDKGANSLARLVKPNGRMFISVPDKQDPAFTLRIKDLLRITTVIPKGLLVYLCWGMAPALWFGRMLVHRPGNSLRTSAFLLFNAMHSKFSRHTHDEVLSWFDENEFNELTAIEGLHTVNIRGIKTVK